MSNGRVFLGVGMGYAPADFQVYNLNVHHRRSLFEEGLHILHQAIAGVEVEFSGKRYHTGKIQIQPRPVQQPLPIYVGAWSHPGVERAAHLGDGWITDTINTSTSLKGLATAYQEACVHSNKQAEILLMRECFCGRTRAQAEERYEPYVLKAHRLYYGFGAYNPDLEPWMAGVPTPEELTLDHIKEQRFILGDPDECIEQIEHYIEVLDTRTFILRMRQAWGPSHAQTVEAIRLFGEQVIPYFRRKYG